MSSSVKATVARLISCIALFSLVANGVAFRVPNRVANSNRQLNASRTHRVATRAAKSGSAAEAARVIGKIAFASDRDGNMEIYVMDSDGGGQTRLTEDAGEDFSPSWSPDGSRLTFISTRDGNAEVYVMNVDGTGQTRLTNTTSGEVSPVYTQDGSQIAFISNRDGNDEIYVMNADGSNQTNLTRNPADDSSLSFSPD